MIIYLDDLVWASFHPSGYVLDTEVAPRRANALTALRLYRRA